MIPLRYFVLLWGLLLGVAMPLQSQEDDALRNWLATLRTLEARFEQQVFDELGVLRERSMGTLYIRRPGELRWVYREPYPLLLVADGEQLWQYDEDLAQATVSPLDQALRSGPLSLMLGREALDALFLINGPLSHPRGQWYDLIPRDPQEEGFERLAVLLEQGQLRQIELYDAFKQRTRLVLDVQQRNAPLDDALFHFVPPSGSDVLQTQ